MLSVYHSSEIFTDEPKIPVMYFQSSTVKFLTNSFLMVRNVKVWFLKVHSTERNSSKLTLQS